MNGWTCVGDDCRSFYGYRISSLVRSNFKFDSRRRPFCLLCWYIEEHRQLEAVIDSDHGVTKCPNQ